MRFGRFHAFGCSLVRGVFRLRKLIFGCGEEDLKQQSRVKSGRVLFAMSNDEISENFLPQQAALPADVAEKFAPLMAESALKGLTPCCRKTVRSHVAHNPMMVCPDCKMMIKCFSDEKSFNNYVTFCKSRGRRIKSVTDAGFYFVMYNNYPMSIGGG